MVRNQYKNNRSLVISGALKTAQLALFIFFSFAARGTDWPQLSNWKKILHAFLPLKETINLTQIIVTECNI